MPGWLLAIVLVSYMVMVLLAYDFFEKRYFPEVTFMHGETGNGLAALAAWFWWFSLPLVGVLRLLGRAQPRQSHPAH